MKTCSFLIPIFDWNVEVIYNVKLSDIDDLKEYLMPKDIEESTINKIIRDAKNGDSGCLSRKSRRTFILVLTSVPTECSVLQSISHEVSHMMEHISEYQGLKGEGLAYTTDYVWKCLYDLGVYDDMMSNLSKEYKTDKSSHTQDSEVEHLEEDVA